jgi:ribosomal-protein-alanine N-acetyltransferase
LGPPRARGAALDWGVVSKTSPAPQPRPKHTRTRVIARGERVVLRTPTWADERELLALRRASRAFHAPWEAEIPGVDPCSREFFARYMRFGHGEHRLRVLVCDHVANAIVGSISMSDWRRGSKRPVQLGYWIGSAHARRGYMTEAMQLLIAHAFGPMRLDRLDAYVLPENTASRGLLAKLGFQCAGIVPAFRTLHGVPRDHERWTITCPSRAGSGSPG